MRRDYPDPIEVKSSRTFYCIKCGERWPETRILHQDGVYTDRRCPNCYEPNGGEIERNRDRAAASELAGAISARFAHPAKFPFWLDDITSVSVITTFTPEPRTLTRGGAPAALVVAGNGFASDATIAYGHAGITDAVSPVITSTSITLSVQASGAVPLGYHPFTLNDILYRNVFDVRA